MNDENRIEVSDRMNGTSNMATLDERAIAAAMPASNVANLNVTKSSKVHIGPKFVSVTQNVQNAEMVKGKQRMRIIILPLFAVNLFTQISWR